MYVFQESLVVSGCYGATADGMSKWRCDRCVKQNLSAVSIAVIMNWNVCSLSAGFEQQRLWGLDTHGRFSAIFTRETTFVTSCLAVLYTKLFLKRVCSKRNF